MSYQKGQILPYIAPRGLTGAALPERRWHALQVEPQRERATRETLKAAGIFAFYPEEERERWKNGRRIVSVVPQVTRLVYAKFKAVPNWDVLRDRRIITGVVTSGGRPIDIPKGVIRRIQGLPERAEVMRQAAEELAALRVGQQSALLEGPLADLAVEVESISDRRVWWVTALGFRGNTTIDNMAGAITPITPERLTQVFHDRGLDFAEACVDVSINHCGLDAARAAVQRLEELRSEA